MSMKFNRPELEGKRRVPLAGGQPGAHEFVRTATVLVGPDDTCDFIGTTDVEIEAACAWVFANYGGGIVHVRNATYTGSVTVDESNIILEGEGWDTIIDGGVAGHAINVTGANCVVRDLQAKTDVGQGNPFTGIIFIGTADYGRVINVFINGSDEHGIICYGLRSIIENCYVFDPDGLGIVASADGETTVSSCYVNQSGAQGYYTNGRAIFSNCSVINAGTYGFHIDTLGDNSIITGCFSDTTGDDGIYINAAAENCVVDGNRITGWTNEPIDDDSDTSWVSNNNCGGDVMNSKGCSFLTVQLSVSYLGGDGWVEVPDGTFSEAVTMPDNEVLLRGRGWGSIIDGALVGHAVDVSGDNCILRDLVVRTTPGGTNDFDGITSTGEYLRIENVKVNGSDRHGISLYGIFNLVENCFVYDPDTYGIYATATGDNSSIVDNQIDTTGNDGIYIHADAEYCIAVNNHITNWNNEPIDDNSRTSLVADNWCGGPVMNSKGCSFATVQLSITHVGAQGWVEVPSGTWSEAVTMPNNLVILRGQGWDSIIDGGVAGHAVAISGHNCEIRDIAVLTTPGQGNPFDGVHITGWNTSVFNIAVNDSDRIGIYVHQLRARIISCHIDDSDDMNIYIDSSGDDTIVTACVCLSAGDDGIYIDTAAENCVISENRISGWTNEPIDDDSDTSLVSDNNCGGDVMNSKGCSFLTVQLSVTHLAGDGWVEVPEGTWTEDVSITNDNVTLFGVGDASIIDGTNVNQAIRFTNQSNIVIRDLAVKTTGGTLNGIFMAVSGTTVNNIKIIRVHVLEATGSGIWIRSYGTNSVLSDVEITGCIIENCASQGIYARGEGDDNQYVIRLNIHNNIIKDITQRGIYLRNDVWYSIVADNHVYTTGGNGIELDADADWSCVDGNNIKAFVGAGILDNSGTSTVGDNEVNA